MTVAKVTGLKAEINETNATFTWTAVRDAAGYELAQYDAAQNKYILKSAVVGTNAKLSNLEEGKTHLFAVRAYVTESGTKVYGPWSDQVSVKIEEAKPADPSGLVKPTGLHAAKTDATVNLSWTAVAGAAGYEVATVDGTAYQKVTEVTGTSAKLTNLERHKELNLVVRAFVKSGKNYGYGPYSDPVKVIVYNADYYGALLRSGKFRMTMYADLDGTGEQPINFAIRNGDLNFSGTMEVFDGKKTPVECRVLKNGTKLYMKLGSGLGATWLDASELFKEGGEFSDMSDMMNMSSMFEGVDFDTSKGVAMSTETRGGVTYEVETLQNGSQVTKLYTVNNDLRMIVSQDQYGTQEIRIQNLSGDVSDSLFTEPVGAVDLSIFMALAGG